MVQLGALAGQPVGLALDLGDVIPLEQALGPSEPVLGTFMLLSGGTDLGTGLDTVTTKMVAECLCTRLADVSLIAADTDVTPFDTGAYASSGTFFSGGAALDSSSTGTPIPTLAVMLSCFVGHR